MLEIYKPLTNYKDVANKISNAIIGAERDQAPIPDEVLFELPRDILATIAFYRAKSGDEEDLPGRYGNLWVGWGWEKEDYQTSWFIFERRILALSDPDIEPMEFLYEILRTPYGVRVFERNLSNPHPDIAITPLILGEEAKLEILKAFSSSFLNTPLPVSLN
ncbi:hypothetical protein HYS91_01885 [Candidatus Daviesbacteria bacterium]|nr:hypothetical protein [Candidatus Daviesbacteria bacterium]